MIIAATVEEALTTYGPLGIIAAFGIWFFKMTVDRLIKDRDHERDLRESLVQDVITRAIPLIEKCTNTLNARSEVDKEIIELLRDLRARGR